MACLKYRQDETLSEGRRTLAIKLLTKTLEHGPRVIKGQRIIPLDNFNLLNLTEDH